MANMAYIGYEKCGCCTLAFYDSPKAILDASSDVAKLRKRGGHLEHVVASEVWSLFGEQCDSHKTQYEMDMK